MKTLELTRQDLLEEFQKVELMDVEWEMVNWDEVFGWDCFDDFVLIDGAEFWEQKRLVKDDY